jgi:hypothetical protein
MLIYAIKYERGSLWPKNKIRGIEDFADLVDCDLVDVLFITPLVRCT